MSRFKTNKSEKRILKEIFGNTTAQTPDLILCDDNDSTNDKITSGYNQWSFVGNDIYIPTTMTKKKLVPGMYSITVVQNQLALVKRNIVVDELLEFPDSVIDTVIKEIVDFWDKKDEFKKYKFLHRRGYLFYGPQGSGKSCVVQQIVKRIIDRNGIVLQCNSVPQSVDSILQSIRIIEPDTHIVCLFEDIEDIFDEYGEHSLLSVLDGENQLDNVLNIATTNYPEKLDKRIIARPRRFDRVIKIDFPNASVRKIYFKEKLKIDSDDLDFWIENTDKFSFAAMAELVISVKCLGNDFNTTVKILKDLMVKKVSSEQFDELGEFGFNQTNNNNNE